MNLQLCFFYCPSEKESLLVLDVIMKLWEIFLRPIIIYNESMILITFGLFYKVYQMLCTYFISECYCVLQIALRDLRLCEQSLLFLI